MNTWIFAQVVRNLFDTDPPTDPSALYMVSMSLEGSAWSTTSGMSYSSFSSLLPHFGVNTPEELTGKSFQSQKDDPFGAINLLVLEIKNSGQYVPPTPEALWERAIESLARLEAPDYSDVESETVYDAYRMVFKFFSAEEDWFSWFTGQIFERSNGKVKLEKADVNEFSSRVKGPAEYLKLVAGDREVLVILGPYSHPISIES